MAADPTTVVLRMGGFEATVPLRTLSGTDWRDMKRATGLHQVEILEGNMVGDFDCQAALMWVALRRTYEEVTYEEVLAAFSHDSVGVGPPPEDDEGG